MRIFKTMAAASVLLNRQELALINDNGKHSFVYRDDATGIVTLRESLELGVLRYRGAWNSERDYFIGDMVTHDGTTYTAASPSEDIEPGVTMGWESYWTES